MYARTALPGEKSLSVIMPVTVCTMLALSVVIVLAPDIAIMTLWFSLWAGALCIFMAGLPAAERRFLAVYVIAGLAIRMMAAIAFRLSNADTGGLITPDEFYYYDYSKEIADFWKSGVFLSLNEIHSLTSTRNYGFHLYDALHFLLLEDKLVPVISNIFLDIFTSLLIFRFALNNFGRKLANVSFFILIFNPYMIYWSTFNLKDTLLTFLTALLIYTLGKVKKSTLSMALLIAILVLFATIRFYMTFMFVILLGGLVLLNSEYKIKYKLFIGTTAVAAVLILYLYTPLDNTLKELMSDGVGQTVHAYSTRSFDIAQDLDYSTQHIKGYGPKSLLISTSHALLAPSPFNWEGGGKYLFPGTIFWYLLLPYYFVGTLIFIKSSYLRFRYLLLWLFPLFMITVMIFMPAINEPRHRLVIFPYAAVLASAGIYYKYRYKKAIVIITYLIIVCVLIGRELIV